MSTTQEDLPARVRRARKSLGWTQGELAEHAGVSTKTIQNFEGRRGTPQGGNLQAILRAVQLGDEDEGIAEATREEWRPRIRIHLDVIGAYLDSLPEEEADRVMHDDIRRIFKDRARASGE